VIRVDCGKAKIFDDRCHHSPKAVFTNDHIIIPNFVAFIDVMFRALP
jgi:hypothetical protein